MCLGYFALGNSANINENVVTAVKGTAENRPLSYKRGGIAMNQRKQALDQYLGQMVHVIVDRPMGYIHGDIVYPVNYGYIPGVIAGDGEEQDAYILGVDTALETFDGVVIGIVCRMNDVEDISGFTGCKGSVDGIASLK